nr:type VI secretion system tip protein VgrG [Opitutaceae bacterium]
LYDHKGMGTELAKSRQQELDERFDTGSGAGTCRTFSPGHSFSMDRHHAASEKGKQWVLLEVEHDMMDGASYLTQRDAKDLKGYRNTFTCMPSDRAHRPARETLKPAVRGCQTAVVVGPQGPHYKAGHEVHVDDLGRVKVRFHWDRYAKDDDNSSCWIRVSQAWAGPGMGGMVIPRIGQEVIVDFLEGDPDRPIIIGRVYNAEAPPNASTVGADEMKRMREKSSSVNKQASAASKPPDKHAPDDDAPEEPGVKPSPVSAAERGSSVLAAAKASLPTGLADLAKRKADNKEPPKAAGISAAFHTTSFKSESLNGGGGSNEISMNDAGGSEAMFFRAQKDEVHTVGNDQSHAVANDQMVEVGNNKTQTIGNNETKSVATNQTTTVGSNQSNTVGASKTEKVALMSNEMVGVSKTTTVGAAYAVTVGAVHTVTVGGLMNTAVGFMSKEQVGVSKTVNVGSNIEIVCGSSKLTMDSAGNIVLEGVNITIKGSSTIKYESGGTFDSTSAGAMNLTSKSVMVSQATESMVMNSGNSIVCNAAQAFAASAGQKMALVAGAGMTINGGPSVDVDGGVIDLN